MVAPSRSQAPWDFGRILRPMAREAADAGPGTASAVGRFMAGSLLAIAVVVVGGFFALRSVAQSEAEQESRGTVVLEGGRAQRVWRTGVLQGAGRAPPRLNRLVVAQLLSGQVVRVKLWTRSGRILYSDE